MFDAPASGLDLGDSLLSAVELAGTLDTDYRGHPDSDHAAVPRLRLAERALNHSEITQPGRADGSGPGALTDPGAGRVAFP